MTVTVCLHPFTQPHTAHHPPAGCLFNFTFLPMCYTDLKPDDEFRRFLIETSPKTLSKKSTLNIYEVWCPIFNRHEMPFGL